MTKKETEEFVLNESFEDLLNETIGKDTKFEGSVVKGPIIELDSDFATIDVGLKSEGKVPLKEFNASAKDLTVGDQVDVYIERVESKNGSAVLSREKAVREEAWVELEKLYNNGEHVVGTIFNKIRGGFAVDVMGTVAFLPGSQIDVRPIKDATPLMNNPQPFAIVKMDKQRGNIVVSRRAILEENQEETRAELLSKMEEGQVVKGIVKNITDYGAFIDLGGIDGLLHVTDISWSRINHPSEALQIGQTIDVKITKFNKETNRISLGMKQLEENPWIDVSKRYKVGQVVKGKVTNITDYGAFIELEKGLEGLTHVSEISWTKKNINPAKVVSTSQEVDAMILEVDEEKQRISLGLKQCTPNPWESFHNEHPDGEVIEGPVKNITEFGLFIGLNEEIDGMVHLSDISWDISGEEAVKEYKKGDIVKARILDVNIEKERISLGIKQLTEDTFESSLKGIKKGSAVKGKISKVLEEGVEVEINEELHGFVKVTDLAKAKADQDVTKYNEGDEIEAKVVSIDRSSRKVALSVRALEIAAEKEAIAEYTKNEEFTSSFGDILDNALNSKK
jgi:small subunit ribosomal protein S1